MLPGHAILGHASLAILGHATLLTRSRMWTAFDNARIVDGVDNVLSVDSAQEWTLVGNFYSVDSAKSDHSVNNAHFPNAATTL